MFYHVYVSRHKISISSQSNTKGGPGHVSQTEAVLGQTSFSHNNRSYPGGISWPFPGEAKLAGLKAGGPEQPGIRRYIPSFSRSNRDG